MTDPTPATPEPEPTGGEVPAFDFGGLLEAAQSMQAQLQDAQARAAETSVEGAAGGGAVRISATAGLEFREVHIRADAAGPAAQQEDIELLEDLVLAALRDVVARANEVQASAFGGLGALGDLGQLGANLGLE